MLIEHQPATLSLQGQSHLPFHRDSEGLTRTESNPTTDWLSSLREIVRARSDDAKQPPSSRVHHAGKNGIDVGHEARIGPDEVEGGLYGLVQQSGMPGTAGSASRAEGARTASGVLEGA